MRLNAAAATPPAVFPVVSAVSVFVPGTAAVSTHIACFSLICILPPPRAHLLYTLQRPFCVLDQSALLGELQFAFVTFLLGHVYDAFEQWKQLVALLTKCDDALATRHPWLGLDFDRLRTGAFQHHSALSTRLLFSCSSIYFIGTIICDGVANGGGSDCAVTVCCDGVLCQCAHRYNHLRWCGQRWWQ